MIDEHYKISNGGGYKALYKKPYLKVCPLRGRRHLCNTSTSPKSSFEEYGWEEL